MADITSGCTITEMSSPLGGKCVMIKTAATAAQNDTFSVTIANYGIKNVLWAYGVYHTTDYNVMVLATGTTALSGGVFTITDTTAQTKRRVWVIIGE